MDLKGYFESKKGLGVLATADAEGKVDLAVYSRPHVMDAQTVAFIMPDRLKFRIDPRPENIEPVKNFLGSTGSRGFTGLCGYPGKL